MLEYAGSQRAGLERNRGDGLALGKRCCESLDWVLVLGVAGLVADGSLGDLRRHAVRRRRAIRTTTCSGRSSTSSSAGSLLLVGVLIDPDMYRRYWRPIFIGTVALIAMCSSWAGPRAARHAGSTSASSRSSRPSWASSSSSSRLPGTSPTVEGAVTESPQTLRTLGLGATRSCSCSPNRTSGRRSSTSAALSAMLFVCGTPGSNSQCSGRSACSRSWSSSGQAPRSGFSFLQPYQKSRLTCFVPPQKCTVDARYNLEQSIAAVSSAVPRPRPQELDADAAQLPARSTGRTSCSPRFSEQRGSFSLLLALFLLVLWRGVADRHGRA